VPHAAAGERGRPGVESKWEGGGKGQSGRPRKTRKKDKLKDGYQPEKEETVGFLTKVPSAKQKQGKGGGAIA